MKTNFYDKSIIAILGPSGAGKTTLGDKLAARNHIAIPRHCTTRLRRSDDRANFYRFLSHKEYKLLLEQNRFLISSGDGPEVAEEYGNFYGILIEDCVAAWKDSNIILLFVSYKDIETLVSLKESGMKLEIINLTFYNIENGVRNRITQDPARNHTPGDIENRIRIALEDDLKYRESINKYASSIIYTDCLNAEETYEKVCKDLQLKKYTSGR